MKTHLEKLREILMPVLPDGVHVEYKVKDSLSSFESADELLFTHVSEPIFQLYAYCTDKDTKYHFSPRQSWGYGYASPNKFYSDGKPHWVSFDYSIDRHLEKEECITHKIPTDQYDNVYIYALCKDSKIGKNPKLIINDFLATCVPYYHACLLAGPRIRKKVAKEQQLVSKMNIILGSVGRPLIDKADEFGSLYLGNGELKFNGYNSFTITKNDLSIDEVLAMTPELSERYNKRFS